MTLEGFHGVEINSSLDFTLGEIVNARANKRTDKYGGSLQNRTRIILDIIGKIR